MIKQCVLPLQGVWVQFLVGELCARRPKILKRQYCSKEIIPSFKSPVLANLIER